MSIIPVTAFPREPLNTLSLTGETSQIALQADPRFSYRAYIADIHYPQELTSTKKLPVLVAIMEPLDIRSAIWLLGKNSRIPMAA